MDIILMIVTFLSLALAIGVGGFAARVAREERRRSRARVAALTEMAAEAALEERQRSEAPNPQVITSVRRAGVQQPPAASAVHRRTRLASIDDLEIRPVARDGAADLFVLPERSSPWGRRMAIIALLALLIGIGLFGATAPIDSTLADGVRQQEVAVRTVPPSIAPLELVSLRHTQHAGIFNVAGLVENPREGAPLSRITATVAVFGRDGAMLALGRAPLDFTTLSPGAKSTFAIEVPVSGVVTRYRIGFRDQNDRVIEHVDRRVTSEALAQVGRSFSSARD